ncbi:MAG: Uncharacterized protein G01um101493_255, partial [Microgenomates group bacterium Gr01-1014_93]
MKSSLNSKNIQNIEWKDALIPGFKENQVQEKPNWSMLFFGILTLVIFFGLFLRLFHLQVVKGSENRQLADGNRIKIKVIHAPRGVIFDRNGEVLAQNLAGFRLLDPKHKKTSFVSREEARNLEVKNDPKINFLEVDNIRTYPQKAVTSHLVGYMGEISEEQLKNPIYKAYKSGDKIGVLGIEGKYEDLLRGKDGGEIIEVDASGNPLRTLGKVHPISGENLNLTLDLNLQKKSYEALKEALQKSGSCCGALIVSNPNTGEILSLVSLPSFDPNIFENGGEKTEEILSSKNFPLLNRVISGTYQPGSTFKIISSAAALESGKIKPETTIEDQGVITLSGQKFANWYFTEYGRLEGHVNLVKAIKRSTDTFYYFVGQTLGEGPLIELARKFKLGNKLDIDIPGEVEGLVGDPGWKEKNQDLPWYPGDTLHLSIGQGFILSTPLQIHGLISYVAADGKLYKPYLLKDS